MPDKRRASQYADEVVTARQTGDAATERRAFANLAAVCRESGWTIETVLSDAQYRAAAQVPPHH